MKKIIIIICVILFSNQLYAQINFNIKVGSGLNNTVYFLKNKIYSRSHRLKAIKTSPLMSYTIGGSIGLLINKKNKIATDFMFINKGFNQYLFDPEDYINVQNYYLSIPVYFNHYISKKTGLNLGIVNNFSLKNSFSFDDMNKYNLGITTGLFYSTNKIILSIDFQTDIQPYITYDVIDSYQNTYNYSIMLSFSYKLFKI